MLVSGTINTLVDGTINTLVDGTINTLVDGTINTLVDGTIAIIAAYGSVVTSSDLLFPASAQWFYLGSIPGQSKIMNIPLNMELWTLNVVLWTLLTNV